jgi:hypothetical protein
MLNCPNNSGIQALYQASINTAEPSSADPYTSFALESHTSAFDHSSQLYMNIDLAWKFTEAQVVQHLKSFLEGYVRGNKLAFETKFRFGPWLDGAKAQRALERECTSGFNKLHWNVRDHPTNYLVIGLSDAIWKVLEAALDANLAILHCLIEKGDVQHQRISLRVRKKYGTCTRARLGKLRPTVADVEDMFTSRPELLARLNVRWKCRRPSSNSESTCMKD